MLAGGTSWLMEWNPDYWPIIAFAFAFAAQWGVFQARARGTQHQINELRDDLKLHLQEGLTIRDTLARVDERTKGMAERMERIENQLNGAGK